MAKGSMRRDEILETAAALIAHSGARTTLKEIADACGILAGTLYYHFDSKEALVLELVGRYSADLDAVARVALDDLERAGSSSGPDLVVALGEAIAACAVKHRAALLLTYYEPPAGADEEFARLAERSPAAVRAAMLTLLETGRSLGWVRPAVDTALLADRLCQSMLHVGIGVSHRMPGAGRVPAIRCSALLYGVATTSVDDAALDRSDAFRTADSIIAGLRRLDAGDGGRAALILRVARDEFGRRGYENTTMRDIAAAAGLPAASLYRVIASKEELLVTIMQSYISQMTAGWDAVLRSVSTVQEKLDALAWLNINIMDTFSEEFRIQFAGLREAPPSSPDLSLTFPAQLRQVKSLVGHGIRAAELHLDAPSANIRARSLFELLWTPESIVRVATPRGALDFVRNTLLRGAADAGSGHRPAVGPARSRPHQSTGSAWTP